MFEKYKATEKDFEAIEEGIKTVWHPKLNFVFKNKKFVEKVIAVSYDSENFYLWSRTKFPKLIQIKCCLKKYFAYRIPHRLKIPDDDQFGWRAGLKLPKKSTRLLLTKLKTDEMSTPFISGGLLIPFIKLQKKMKDRKHNPYTTHESYLATIIHEFGHVYWHQHKLWYYSNKKENLLLLKTAKSLYSRSNLSQSKREKLAKIPLRFTSPHGIKGISELFAFCCEYQASMIFWSAHKQNLDIFDANQIEYLLKLEKLKNLDQEDSVLEPSRYPHHDFALVFSKIIMTLYPKTWPQFLIAPTPTILQHIRLS